MTLADKLAEARDLPPITHAWINDCRTVGGGWTREQVEAMGAAWPPEHGWQHRLVGTRISHDARRRVEQVAAESFAWVNAVIDRVRRMEGWPPGYVASLERVRDERRLSLKRWRGLDKDITRLERQIANKRGATLVGAR